MTSCVLLCTLHVVLILRSCCCLSIFIQSASNFLLKFSFRNPNFSVFEFRTPNFQVFLALTKSFSPRKSSYFSSFSHPTMPYCGAPPKWLWLNTSSLWFCYNIWIFSASGLYSLATDCIPTVHTRLSLSGIYSRCLCCWSCVCSFIIFATPAPYSQMSQR